MLFSALARHRSALAPSGDSILPPGLALSGGTLEGVDDSGNPVVVPDTYANRVRYAAGLASGAIRIVPPPAPPPLLPSIAGRVTRINPAVLASVRTPPVIGPGTGGPAPLDAPVAPAAPPTISKGTAALIVGGLILGIGVVIAAEVS